MDPQGLPEAELGVIACRKKDRIEACDRDTLPNQGEMNLLQ